MQFQFDVTPLARPTTTEPPVAVSATSETTDLLRQLLEVQRQQLAHLQAASAAHDAGARWRAFLARWREDFPDLASTCKEVLPLLERSYGALIADLADHLRHHGSDALDTDFALQEFLDRFGMRLAQLGTLVNLVAPLADSNSHGEASS